MTDNKRDVFDALRELDPASAGNAEVDAVLRQAVKTRVLAAEIRPRRSSRRMVIVVAALIALLLALSAAAVISRREPTSLGIACYQTPEHSGARWGISPRQALHPSECEPLWREGRISNPNLGPPGYVPPLVGCVIPSGALAVFPSDDEQLCDRLGLARYVQPTQTDGVELLNELVDWISEEGCIAIPDAEAWIQAVLDDRGLDDWSVTVSSPPSSERPCASLAFNGGERSISLVPIPQVSDG